MAKRKAGADNPFVPKHEFDSYIVPAQLMSDVYEHLDLLQTLTNGKDTAHLLRKLKAFAKKNSL